MLKPFKDQAGNVRLTVEGSVLIVTKPEYEEFLRAIHSGEYDYSLLEND